MAVSGKTRGHRLLNRTEAAQRCHMTPWRFAVLAKSNPVLLRGFRPRGKRSHFWLEAAVDAYLERGMLRNRSAS